MAIDVMSRANCIPIIVGDVEDMKNIISVTAADSKGSAYLSMLDEAGATHTLEISSESSENFAHNDYALLVSLAENDEIASAVLWPLNNKPLPVKVLDEAAIKKLTEDLVAEDFRLDFPQVTCPVFQGFTEQADAHIGKVSICLIC